MGDIVTAIKALEQALVREGGFGDRKLVLDTEPAQIDWATAPGVPPDARAWLSWRAVQEHPPYLLLPPECPRHVHIVAVGGEEWRRLVDEAAQGGRPELFPLLSAIYCDGRDGTLWTTDYDDDGVVIFVPLDHTVASLVGAIAEQYEAFATSPWRRLRVDASVPVVLTALERFEAADLASLPAGSLVITTFSVQKRYVKRGWIALKVAPDTWLSTHNRQWDGGDVDQFDLSSLLDLFRTAFAGEPPKIDSDESQARLLARDTAKPGFVIRLTSFRVWRQPSMDDLVSRLDRALARFPEVRATLRAGASEADIQDAERVLGAPLPLDLRRLYAFADGQQVPEGSPTLYWRYRWLPLREAIESSHKDIGELPLLPFLDKSSGDAIYADVAGELASPGAIIDFDHEHPERRRVLYGSTHEWLECFVDALEADLFVFDDQALFPRAFVEDGDLIAIQDHDRVRTNQRFPWDRPSRKS